MLHLNPQLPHSNFGTWAHYLIFTCISGNRGFLLLQVGVLIAGTSWWDGRTREKCVLSLAQSVTQSKCSSRWYLFLFLPALVPHRWTLSSETLVNDVVTSYYNRIYASRLCVHQSPPRKSSGPSSGQLGGAVVKLQPSLQDGALGMEVASANLRWLLGIRVPGPPQPPGSPVGVQRAPLAPPKLLA